MSKSVYAKINNSSLQVLKTFLLLLQGNYSMSEMITKLNENECEPIFNNSIISKYINTCRYCGIEIYKIQNKYYLSKLPFGLCLNSDEIKLLHILQEAAKDILTKKTYQIFGNFISNVGKYSDKQVVRIDKNTINMAKEFFIKAYERKHKVDLMFLNGDIITCNPLNIIEKNNETFFNVLINGQEKSYSEKRIRGIKISDHTFIPDIFPKEVLFKITGDLAKRYSSRTNEVVSYIKEGELLITNYCDDKEALFERLMRYDSCCEIIRPAEYREEFKRLISDTLSNYEEI